jgi:hypothetical protein
METFLSLCVGIGLAAACGFRVFVPLLVMSLMAQSGHLELTAHFAWIGTPYAGTAFAVATLVEILAYYIPYIDNLLDVISTPLAIVAGIVVTLSVLTGLPTFWTWSLALIAGGGVAGSTQTGTVALRGASTVTTAGIGNALVSTGELFGAVGTALLAIVLPIVALVVVVIFLLFLSRRMFLRFARSR